MPVEQLRGGSVRMSVRHIVCPEADKGNGNIPGRDGGCRYCSDRTGRGEAIRLTAACYSRYIPFKGGIGCAYGRHRTVPRDRKDRKIEPGVVCSAQKDGNHKQQTDDMIAQYMHRRRKNNKKKNPVRIQIQTELFFLQ